MFVLRTFEGSPYRTKKEPFWHPFFLECNTKRGHEQYSLKHVKGPILIYPFPHNIVTYLMILLLVFLCVDIFQVKLESLVPQYVVVFEEPFPVTDTGKVCIIPTA